VNHPFGGRPPSPRSIDRRRQACDDRTFVQRLGHVPALDGLRGVAILLVVTYHYSGWPRGGHRGVDLFFVLSGFLITTLLLEERSDVGGVSLRGFYARRARRLFPALAVVLAAYLTISAARGVDAFGTIARYGLYVGNVYQAFWVDAGHAPLNGLTHLWSLAEEEQFYLLWPLTLLLVARSRRPLAWLAAVTGALILYRLTLLGVGASGRHLYFSPDMRADGLLIGCWLAFYRLRRGRLTPSRRLLVAAVAAAVICVLLLPGALVVFELAVAVLLAAAVTHTRLAEALAARPLVWLGGISYSLYLWHPVVLWTFHRQERLLALALSVALAYASTRWIERPLRRKRRGYVPVPAPAS
jgi:peptidoglycan/LPS O-acetylase OafA/YrhL